MKTVQLTTDGIRKHLNSTTSEQAIAEYIWNGIDAKATDIIISQITNEAGGIEEISISDNGDGISYEDLETKFGVFLDSEKIKIRQSTKRISSENHGRDGIGRLTFFIFSQDAEWHTVYERAGEKYEYTIKVSSNDLIRYPLIYEIKKVDQKIPKGTTVKFTNIKSGVISLNSVALRNYLVCEFCWMLTLQENLKISVVI